MDLDLLISQFRGPLIGLFASWGASPFDARELAQDTFAEAYLGRERFHGDHDDPAQLGAWLRGIANHLHQAHLRRPRRTEPLAGQDPGAETVDPRLEARREEIRGALEGLRGPWRTVLQMRYVEGSALSEIAALLGISERSVEGRLHRARKELRQVLEARTAAGEAGCARSAEDCS